MAINFPNTPANGEEFTDPGSLTTWRYNEAWDAWTSVSAGVSNINYRGGINFTVTYVENNIVPQAGDIYNNNTDGTAHPNFTGIAGEPVAVGALYLYDGTNWNSLDLQASPFTRNPATGIITPVRGGDDLDMTVAGSYLIQTLPDLDTGVGGGTDPVTITLSTTSWAGTDALDIRFHSCDAAGDPGVNDSPALSWAVTGDIPDGSEFRITCIDRDANNFIHWSIVSIPTNVTSIGENGDLPNGAQALPSDFGGGDRANGWNGPCPPPNDGDHNYSFVVTLNTSDGNTLATSNALVSTIPT